MPGRPRRCSPRVAAGRSLDQFLAASPPRPSATRWARRSSALRGWLLRSGCSMPTRIRATSPFARAGWCSTTSAAFAVFAPTSRGLRRMPQALRRRDRAGLVDAATRFGFKLRTAATTPRPRALRARLLLSAAAGRTDGHSGRRRGRHEAGDERQARDGEARDAAAPAVPLAVALRALRCAFKAGRRRDWGELEREAFNGIGRQVGSAEQL